MTYSVIGLLAITVHCIINNDVFRRGRRESLPEEKSYRMFLFFVIAYHTTDALWGILYARRIGRGEAPAFAAAVFDLNGLKRVNDTRGHEAGDRYIVEGCRVICDVFRHSPVYRVGGDEFVAILEGRDYEDRATLMAAFRAEMEENLRSGGAVVSSGLSDFRPGEDNACTTVFERADEDMYRCKRRLKELEADGGESLRAL